MRPDNLARVAPQWPRRAVRIAALGLSVGAPLVVGWSCRNDQETGANLVRRVEWPQVAAPLPDSFELVQSIRFPVSKSDTAVLGIRRLDIDGSGRLLITDSRAGNLKLVSPHGAIIAVIGRKGDGPGEFRTPYDAQFSPNGGIVAVDPTLSRVSYFTLAGEYLSSFTPAGQDPRLIAAVGGSSVTIGGLADVGRDDALFVTYDQRGIRLAKFGSVDKQVYAVRLVVDNPWAAASAGRVVGGMSVAPSIDEYDPQGQLARRSTLLGAPPGWRQLEPVKSGGELRLPADVKAWIQASSLVMGAGILADGRLAVGTRLGSEDYLYLFERDLWPCAAFVLPYRGRLLGAWGNLVYVVDEEGDEVVLMTYRWKDRGS